MRLKNIAFDFPVCLAPMAGYTDMSFRVLCREHGADIVTTEMISAKGLCYGGANTRALLMSCAGEQPVVAQLFGREPETVAEAVKICEDSFGGGLLAIDLNMGCPAPKITGGGEGSALMKEPDLAGRIVSAAVKAAGVPVTVKCRSGWDAAHVNAVAFTHVCEESGAALITLHARTREQYYGGKADMELVARVKDALRVPLIASGDIGSGEDALRVKAQTRCDGVAIGRAALGNPWIFEEIKAALDGKDYTPPAEAERRETALRHARMAMESKGGHALVELRKHIAWYIRGIAGASKLRVRVNAAQSYEELAEILT